MKPPQFIRVGCNICHASNGKPVRTCKTEFEASLRLREYIRLDGGNLGQISK